MEETKNKIKFWRGTRESYNKIASPDFWTRYSVKEPNGVWHEYYGTNLITSQAGTLAPVLDVVKELPKTVNPGDRYLVGDESVLYSTYQIFEFSPFMQDGKYLLTEKVTDLGDLSVRIKSRGLMTYQVVEGKLITYDKVNSIDCGTF
jgi:hypothetical protein